jgi:hypothetical protein
MRLIVLRQVIRDSAEFVFLTQSLYFSTISPVIIKVFSDLDVSLGKIEAFAKRTGKYGEQKHRF